MSTVFIIEQTLTYQCFIQTLKAIQLLKNIKRIKVLAFGFAEHSSNFRYFFECIDDKIIIKLIRITQ